MESSRLPRFKRAAVVVPIKLTERDGEIIRLVHRNRFLRSSHIVSLIGGSPQQLLRRLKLLYHHGFLERPRAQLDYYHQGGSHHMVYGLGNKGASLLKRENGVTARPLPWSEKNRSVSRLYIEHALLVSDFMVALELGCRKTSGVRLLTGDGRTCRPHPFKWRVQVNGRLKLGVVPDLVFALDASNQHGSINRSFFFLEVDRGTMPVIRKSLVQSSFYRKLLAYEATWAKGLHRSQFGFHRFRVLTVTTSAARVKSLVDACSQLKSGHGLFLFCDQATLKQHGDILTMRWITGRHGETGGILD